MDNVPDILVIIALIFFIIEQATAKGRALGWWAGILVCIALLWHLIPT